MAKPIVICGFPGIGKTYASKNFGKTYVSKNVVMSANSLDMDSSEYHWKTRFDGRKKDEVENWEDKYVDAISETYEGFNALRYIFVSTHAKVREKLRERNIPYIIVRPDEGLRNDYMIKYMKRQSDIDSICKLYENWNAWLFDLELDPMPKITLGYDEYLLDILT